MRRFMYALVMLLAIIAVSCNMGDMGSDVPSDGYRIISDVSAIGDGEASRSRSVQIGDPIIGVLLEFDGTDAFHIEYLNGRVGKNGDGMEYNYILHVPAGIADAYREGGGHNPESGNPFWWYMSECFGLSMDKIMSDYSQALDRLLGKVGSTLPVLVPEDVGGQWKDENRFIDDVIEPQDIEEGRLVLIDPDPATSFFDHSIDNQNIGPFADKTGYGDIMQRAFYISPSGALWFPMALVDVYEDYKGVRKSNGDPFWKYLEVYFDISLQDVREEGMEQALEALREKKDELPYPNSKDYYEKDEEKPQEFDISKYEPYFQKEYEKLELVSEWDDDGSITKDLNLSSQREGDLAGSETTREQAYTTFSLTDNPKVYWPVALEYVEHQYDSSYSGNGDALWDYLAVYYPESGMTTDYVRKNGLECLMRFLVNQSQSEEGLAFPKVEDYRRVLVVM